MYRCSELAYGSKLVLTIKIQVALRRHSEAKPEPRLLSLGDIYIIIIINQLPSFQYWQKDFDLVVLE